MNCRFEKFLRRIPEQLPRVQLLGCPGHDCRIVVEEKLVSCKKGKGKFRLSSRKSDRRNIFKLLDGVCHLTDPSAARAIRRMV